MASLWSMKGRRMSFIMVWKVAGELHSPKNMMSGSKSPQFMEKAAFHLSPSLRWCKQYNSELGNSNYYTTFSVSKGVIQRKKESQSSATSSPNDKQIDLALWLWQSKQG